MPVGVPTGVLPVGVPPVGVPTGVLNVGVPPVGVPTGVLNVGVPPVGLPTVSAPTVGVPVGTRAGRTPEAIDVTSHVSRSKFRIRCGQPLSQL